MISISLPSALTSIGYSAFFGCVNLTSLNIPSSVTRIEHDAFNSCSALKTINLPFNVTSIAKHTFAGCSGLTSIEIPESITSIGENAFSGCSSLSVIVIPESVISIDDYAFANCSGLTTAKLPNNNNFQYIRRGLFKECTNLSSINIPNRVETIYDYAFQGCSALASLAIPSSVASIGYQVFEGCCNLKSIVVDKDNSVYDSRNNCNAIISTGTNELKYGCNGTIIPEDVTSIASFAFSGCNHLISIRIPSSVTNISDNSFVDCNGISSIIVDKANAIYDSREDCNAIIETATNKLILASINTTIPKGVEMNSQIAYKNCVSLSLPEGLESIRSSMFENCKQLESITIPGSVKTIDSGAFYNCTSLKNVKFEVGVDPVTFQAYSYYYINWFANCPIEYINIGRNIKYEIAFNNSGNNSLSPFKEKETLTKVDFSDNVSIVSDGMFSGCNNLEIVQLPERMEYIGNSAFYGCSSLVSISLPNGLKNICSSAFSGCKKVSSFIIPNSVESIGESAFYGCEALTSVSIPNSVTYIDRSAFMSCISLSELVFENGNEPLSIRELSYSTAFSGCPISSVYLGRNIINDSYNYIYSSLASFLTPFDLTISKNVTTISGGTFANCERIKTLTFEEGTDELILVNDHNAYNSIMPFANTPIDSIYLGRVIVGTDMYYPECTIKPFACVGSSFSMRIGENIAAIGERAYSEWKIKSLYIPDNVSQIGADAFNDCTSLAFVKIEDGNTPLEFLEGTGFYHCPLKDLYVGRNLTYDSWKSPFRYNKEGLKNLAIGNQVTEIAMNEFVGLKSVTSLQFPTSLTKIGYQAFYGCEALTTITVPNCITTIEEDAFGLCRGLTSFIIEDGVENLSINNNFLNSPLSEVYIGRNITYPEGNSPFSLLESLQLLKIGKEVELIGDRAFLGCQNLTDVFSYADNVPTTGQYVFTESYLPDATLHIPASAFNAYRVRYPWNLFRNFAVIEENGDEYLVTITPGDANGDGVVNAADIVEVVNAKNGNPSANYNAINADMDGSDEVNQTDINAIVDIIMKQ